ncbi:MULTISPECIES: hypothetical protein [Serratia]|uniref:hypothetical protein n=1 Tax=Serratia TaxID=613 RepID=UPI000A886825|nr:hypothetical protein [Serratia marcescens]MBN5333460.1 hypothetical protein [Serratia marcescens]MBN5338570.1 hypothetical protein [Serratia marcescens]MCW7557393.1 hypothetical protein [Serratia marcescens]MCW7562297.1 hypothetical protein [Serratia marcescens]MCW7567099.1 hypothetical protein [Serratia marcescens]
MQEIEAKYFHLIAGAGNFANNRGSNGRVNNNGGNKNNSSSSSSTAIKAAIPAHAQLF